MARMRSTANGVYGGRRIFITSSVYNSAGSTCALAALASSEMTYFYNDALPYTAEGLTQVMVQARPHTIIIIPYALEQLANTSAGVETLKTCDSVSVFGAVCPTQLGDSLVEQGVKLNSGYAM